MPVKVLVVLKVEGVVLVSSIGMEPIAPGMEMNKKIWAGHVTCASLGCELVGKGAGEAWTSRGLGGDKCGG